MLIHTFENVTGILDEIEFFKTVFAKSWSAGIAVKNISYVRSI